MPTKTICNIYDCLSDLFACTFFKSITIHRAGLQVTCWGVCWLYFVDLSGIICAISLFLAIHNSSCSITIVIFLVILNEVLRYFCSHVRMFALKWPIPIYGSWFHAPNIRSIGSLLMILMYGRSFLLLSSILGWSCTLHISFSLWNVVQCY